MNNRLMNNKQFTIYKKIGISLFIVYCLLFIGVPSAQAQTTPPAPTPYTLLAPIPLTNPSGAPDTTTDTSKFLPGLFKLMIAVTTGLAVIMLIYAGVKYISTDAFGGKEEAKGIIENTLWGLLLAMSAWLIVNTINPNLVKFDLKIDRLPIRVDTNTPTNPPGLPGTCANCGLITVPHKTAPDGCAPPGPCTIQTELNNRLVALHALQSLFVTEGYPPTRTHQNPCHNNGSCVDATISSATEANIKRFIENASTVNLNAQFETTSEKRAEDIRRATGLSRSQVYYVAGITGEHFSIYYK